jgi:ABC-2 type transport system permease protein
MRIVWTTTLKDLQRLRRDPGAIIMSMAIPLVITFLLALIFGDGGAKPQGKLLIVDHDRSFLSGILAASFTQGSLRQTITVENQPDSAESTARERVNRDEASAVLIIPKGLGADFLNGTPAQVELITNPAQRILPGIIRQTVSAVLDGADHARMIGGASKIYAALSTPLIQLETKSVASRKQNDFNIGALFFPGMLFVAVLFVSQALSVDIWRENASGTIRRFAASPQTIEAFLAGKVLSTAVVLIAVASVGLLSARWLVKLPVVNLGAAILWVTFSGIALFLLMLVLSLCTTSESASRVVLTILLFVLGMVGGSFFPFEMMPAWLAGIGNWTPNGWAIRNFKTILDGSARLPQVAGATAGLLAVSSVAFFTAAWRIRRAFLS